jgi:hypothetical protein
MDLRAWAVALITLVSAAGSALAQYSNSDPRNSNAEYQRRQNELQQQEKDREDRERSERQSAQDAESYRQFMDNQRKLQERLSGEVERDRAMFLKTPPIPPQKNSLLGQWRLDRTKKKPANAFAEINAAISQPACEMAFGDGVWDFRPKALYGIDAGFGETKLTDVDYRGNEGIIGVIPKSGKLFVFKILGADRVQELTSTRIGADACSFVRVGASAHGASASVAGTRAANASSPNAPPAAAAPGVASPAKVAVAGNAGAVVDGAAFRCRDGSLLHVTWCKGASADAMCTLTELHKAGTGTQTARSAIAARVQGCEAGGIRYGSDNKPIFVR